MTLPNLRAGLRRNIAAFVNFIDHPPPQRPLRLRLEPLIAIILALIVALGVSVLWNLRFARERVDVYQAGYMRGFQDGSTFTRGSIELERLFREGE